MKSNKISLTVPFLSSPEFVSSHTETLLKKLVAQSVHTASPRFIGHMTSALPYFFIAVGQTHGRLEPESGSKSKLQKHFTPLERNVLGMLHHLVYGENEAFYHRWMHNAEYSLGAFCSGGTIANISALWVARNNLLAPRKGFCRSRCGRVSGRFKPLRLQSISYLSF